MQIDELNQYYSNQDARFGLLQGLANYTGDFHVSRNFLKNGDICFGKWSTVLSQNTIKDWSHRQILPYEVVLDMDDPLKIDYTFKLVEKWIEKNVFDEIYLFETGSKGVHCHIFLINDYKTHPTKVFVRMMNEMQILLEKLGFDVQKSSRNVTIALEFAPHWKSGKQKKLLRKKGCIYEKFAIFN